MGQAPFRGQRPPAEAAERLPSPQEASSLWATIGPRALGGNAVDPLAHEAPTEPTGRLELWQGGEQFSASRRKVQVARPST